MADIAPVVGPGTGRLDVVTDAQVRPVPRPVPGRTERPSDRVELSDRARLLNKLINLPDVRRDLVDEVRRSIEAGTYDTPERLDGALNGLADDLDAMS